MQSFTLHPTHPQDQPDGTWMMTRRLRRERQIRIQIFGRIGNGDRLRMCLVTGLTLFHQDWEAALHFIPDLSYFGLPKVLLFHFWLLMRVRWNVLLLKHVRPKHLFMFLTLIDPPKKRVLIYVALVVILFLFFSLLIFVDLLKTLRDI